MTAVLPTYDDTAAIAELHELLALQKKAFRAEPYPTLDVRRERLGALAGMMVMNRDRIREAMSADFAVHPELFTDLVEVLGVAGRAMYAAEQLEAWCAPDERFADPAFYGSAQAAIRMQPKGVVGNIVPWNFPFDLSCGPLVEMLAAGNRVVIKPSDYTPACAELLDEMVRATFDRDLVAVSVGGLELAKAFPTLRWDHLLYTGSPEIGRVVAKAAAENLVPVTLELGGKCPAVIAEDSVDEETVRTVLGTKMIKNGQMCISVDYALVPRAQVDRFVELAQQLVGQDYAAGPDNTGIISERHLDRLTGLVDEARDAGARVVPLGGEGNAGRRQLPISLVVDPPAHLGVMTEEVFGPVLPVVPYDTLEQAVEHVNDGERPLALYVFSKDRDRAEQVLASTTSGGACINSCASHAALPSMGFGGIGQSGSGRHHGIEGFREFSNPRGVFVRGEGDLIEAFLPPYGATAQAIVDAVMGGGDAPVEPQGGV
jgi:coniferyl-aldehyde dehydrogenase